MIVSNSKIIASRDEKKAENQAENPTAIKIKPLTKRGAILPLFRRGKIDPAPYCIAFDWIEYTGKKELEFLNTGSKIVKVADGKHSNYKDVMFWRNNAFEKVATITIELKAGIDVSWTKVKLENRFCYQAGTEIIKMIQQINEGLGIEFKNFTRLDVACDIQRTDYRNFSCQLFMEKVAKKDYVFKGRRCKTIEGENKISEYAISTVDVVSRVGTVETVRCGSMKSGISFIMYNKTKEMAVKGLKPWIVQQWNEAGFDKDCDTYRVEFNYMKAASSFMSVNKKTGETMEMLQHENIGILDELAELFSQLWNKYFVCARREQGVRFSRLKQVKILEFVNPGYIKVRLSEKQKSTNYIKAGIRQDIKYIKQQQDDGQLFHANEIMIMVENKLHLHGLHRWFKNNFPEMSADESVLQRLDWVTLKAIDLTQGVMFN